MNIQQDILTDMYGGYATDHAIITIHFPICIRLTVNGQVA